ncbi:MAG: CRISPR-associated endonuclease Cas2 [Anaerolineae bacterium]|nr:CRISPR-associated endonuclease Cas2 [Anaerolineae bacterium]
MRARLLLIYDIPDDGIRTKVADACLDYGLDRIQYSAFLGQLSTTHQEELMLKVQKKLGDRSGKVSLIPICERDWSARLEIDQDAG